MRKIYRGEGLSGATTKRSVLLRCYKVLDTGDMLIVWRLDWLGRAFSEWNPLQQLALSREQTPAAQAAKSGWETLSTRGLAHLVTILSRESR